MARVAIVGAGLSGLACARELAAAGHAVRLFDKSRGVGGRLATRRTDAGAFDHGAQYFTARDPEFRKTVEQWLAQKLIEAYSGRIATISGGKQTPFAASEPRYVGVPTMNALARALAADLDIVSECTVTQVAHEGGGWRIGAGDAEQPEVFDAVAVTVPAVQAAPLLAAAPALAKEAGGAHYAPCWALLADIEDFGDPGFDAAFVVESALAWVMRDASKPGRDAGNRWVLHGSAIWSTKNLEWEAEDVSGPLLAAFGAMLGRDVAAKWAVAHRWRYALSIGLNASFLWDGDMRIGAAGDWCGDGRVEGAWLSGVRLARAMVATL